MARQLEIRNSTAGFLTFVIEGKEDGIQVVTMWVTQKAKLPDFDVNV